MKNSHTTTQKNRAQKSAHAALGALQRLTAAGYASGPLHDAIDKTREVIRDLERVPVRDNREKSSTLAPCTH